MLMPLGASLAVTLLAFTGIWLIHVFKADVGLVDYYWAPGFVVIAAVDGWHGGLTFHALILVAATSVWALRLTVHLVERHWKSIGEDARYAVMRRAGGAQFWWKNLFSIFWLQAVLQWVIASPLHFAVLQSRSGETGYFLFWAGLLVASFGLALESAADWQLRASRLGKNPSVRLFTGGLWSLSRHPNYLGEVIIWFGFGLSAFAMSGSVLAFSGPVVLTLAIRFVSIPLTEAQMLATRGDEFDAWSKTVPALLPRPPFSQRKTA